jgi:hypothetical protein
MQHEAFININEYELKRTDKETVSMYVEGLR